LATQPGACNPAAYAARLAELATEKHFMRFRSILLLGVSSVALQHADAQTAGVNGVPGSTVIVPRQVFFNRPIYVLPGNADRSTPTNNMPTPATTIYMPPSPFGPGGQLPLVTGGLPGYNAPLPQSTFAIGATKPGAPAGVTAAPIFGANAPIVGQSPTGFAIQPAQPSLPGTKQNP
jgi:hypothetical protein